MRIPEIEYPAYDEVVSGAAYYVEQPTAGYLRLTGPDRVDFLQRQTTNDVRLLAEDRAVVTVLTSPTARILDVYTLIWEPDAIGIIPLPGRAQAAIEYLKSRIFFMDNVAVEDVSESVFQVVIGAKSMEEIAMEMGNAQPENAAAGSASTGSLEVRWVVERGLSGQSYRLMVDHSARGILASLLDLAGAVGLPTQSYEVLRIEAGLPAVDHELTEDYTPFEVGLEETVSSTKGCYTGQEVLARQVTYDKVANQLVGLRLDRPVEAGAAIRSEGSRVGAVTSAAESPRFGPIALAVVRRGVIESSSRLTVEAASGEVNAMIAALPFQ